MPGRFFDTNVLVYLWSEDIPKAMVVRNLLLQDGMISVQVLNEIANVSRRKMKKDWAETRELLEMVRDVLTVLPVTMPVHETGLRLAQRYMTSIYDAMILSAALLAECDELVSEDMRHGLVVEDRLTVRNPFLPA